MAGNTDVEWEKFGKADPYFGVLSHSKFGKQELTEEVLADFFLRGEAHVSRTLETIRNHVSKEFEPKSCLDFGCGVGRLVIPLARQFESVAGVDISESMLKEASKNCESRGLKNVSFHRSDDALSEVKGRFDLIHSHIVFQHIPWKRGEVILKRLLEILNPGGVAVLHFTYGRKANFARKATHYFRKFYLINGLVNKIQGNKFSYPFMRMNNYDLRRLFKIFKENGSTQLYLQMTNHGGHLGAIFFLKKG